MPLTLAYVNEVLNHLPCTVVVDEEYWPGLLKALKFEGRNLEDQIIGLMRLRWAPGGYQGLLNRIAELTEKVKELEDAARSAQTPAEAEATV